MTDQGPISISELSHGRSGDKGNRGNIGVIASDTAAYERLEEQLTANRVADYFESLITGEVRRYELPNIQALNFVGEDALAGGEQASLRYETRGKTYTAALLECELPAWSPEDENG